MMESYIHQRVVQIVLDELKPKDGYIPVKGIDYTDGEAGYTPKKGVDYFDGEPGKDAVIDTDMIKGIISKLIPKSEKTLQKKDVVDMLDELDKSHKASLKKLENTVLLNYGGHGGSGGGTFIYNEVVAGSGTTFTLANTPKAGTVTVYGQGQRLKLTDDYTISGAVITTINSWLATQILADYQK